MIHPKSYYELLEVSPSADAMILRKAFRRLSKALHPDTTSLPAIEAARRFQELCEAYELLSDPIRRKAYDDSLNVVNLSRTIYIDDYLVPNKKVGEKARAMDVRRSLSGGELFSLVSLGIAFLLSLLLAIGFAFTQGREWQSQPSWLVADSSPATVIANCHFNASTPCRSNPIESTLFRSFRSLAAWTWSSKE